MTEDTPLYNGPTIVVTTDDGTLFSCTPYEMGGIMAPRRIRWRLIDARGLTYTGPAFQGESSPADVQRLVSEWWELKKSLGQGGVNAEVMRRRIADGR